ncbi:MAG: type II toxin-antitoxin system death-on-curing family toxin [Candidatus Shapirobacteria bacterium]
MTKAIRLIEVKRITFYLAREFLSFNEAIPDFDTRFSDVLESCLAVPFQRFARHSLYPDLVSQAAMLFYLLVKNHPFQNGNKRIAMTTLLYFLFKNQKWLEIDAKRLYNFAVWVAESPAELKDDTLSAARKFIKRYLVEL